VRLFPGRASPRMLVLIALCLGLIAPQAGATTSAEQAVHAMINESRAPDGLRLLRLSERLSRIAHRHSKQMATQRTLFHTCLPCALGNGDWRKLAENVGFGADTGTVEEQFMASPPHRANILDPKFRRVGVGVVRRGGLVWVTEIFYA
jgi:uncharacterized protein YkwD